MDNIKITKKLKFDFPDLMRDVDLDHEFTLRDVVRAIHNSKISMPVLCQLLRCNYLEKYWEEISSKKFKDGGEIHYLELYWWGTTSKWDNKIDSNQSWCFHGVGKAGYIPDDLKKYCSPEEIKKMKKEKYTESYAIEFTPLYKLANYQIRIRDELWLTHYENIKGDVDDKIKFKPSITLIELLYAIFWELSFLGSPQRRNEQTDKIMSRVDEFKKAEEEGRLDEITVPWKEVKKKLKKKISEIKKAKKVKKI